MSYNYRITFWLRLQRIFLSHTHNYNLYTACIYTYGYIITDSYLQIFGDSLSTEKCGHTLHWNAHKNSIIFTFILNLVCALPSWCFIFLEKSEFSLLYIKKKCIYICIYVIYKWWRCDEKRVNAHGDDFSLFIIYIFFFFFQCEIITWLSFTYQTGFDQPTWTIVSARFAIISLLKWIHLYYNQATYWNFPEENI